MILPAHFFPGIPSFRRRHGGMVVLWGGRPDIDYQFGSPRDRARQRSLAAMRRMRLNLHATQFAIGVRMMPAVKEAVQTMEKFGAALRDIQKAVDA